MMPTAMQHKGPQNPPARSSTLFTHDEGDARRAAVEAFIRDVYGRSYGAQVTHFAPTLVALWEGERITAAAGYRCAGDGPLFLERYLPQPVEQMLAAHAGAAPLRKQVVEVGHLAAARAGEGRRLILMLGPHLGALGCEWVVSTLTGELRQLFLRIGVVPLTLGAADPARLGGGAQTWGTYYDHNPLVLAGHLPRAMRHIARYASSTGIDA